MEDNSNIEADTEKSPKEGVVEEGGNISTNEQKETEDNPPSANVSNDDGEVKQTKTDSY